MTKSNGGLKQAKKEAGEMKDMIAVSVLVPEQPMEFSREWDSPAMQFLRRVHGLLQQAFSDLPYIGGHVRAGQAATCQIHNEFCPENRERYQWHLTHGELWNVAVLMFFPSDGGSHRLDLHSVDFCNRGILASKLSSFARTVTEHDSETGSELARRFAEQFDIPVQAA